MTLLFGSYCSMVTVEVEDKETAKKAVLLANESLFVYSQAVGLLKEDKKDVTKEQYLAEVEKTFEKSWEAKTKKQRK